MATFNGKKSVLASIVAGLAKTVQEGDRAAERFLAGCPRPGDEKRVRSALAVSELVLGGGKAA
jgi:hypothetical protein